ncbi:hypothetical protein CBS101457_005710 [Exobasidium rhododendri]|nr:hypothetical protein CBS101457_005710 [Exobasidium rhododendri]
MSAFFLPLLLLLTTLLHSASALPRLLIFTKVSAGAYTHDSIPTAVDVITRLGEGTLALNDTVADPSLANSNAKWDVVYNNNDTLWEDGTYLNQYDAVAFVMTNDVSPPNDTSVLSNASADAFAKYIESGGGYVGIHCASASLFSHPFYGRLVGAFFDYHPEIQPVGIKALNTDNPSTSRFPAVLNINEEVYHFFTDPRAVVGSNAVLLTNATAFSDPQAASRTRSDGPAPRPLAWFREGGLLDEASTLGEGMDYPADGPVYSGGAGRSWYTSLGHANETWAVDAFHGHILGGIGYVLASS